jgi:hypothetical protein
MLYPKNSEIRSTIKKIDKGIATLNTAIKLTNLVYCFRSKSESHISLRERVLELLEMTMPLIVISAKLKKSKRIVKKLEYLIILLLLKLYLWDLDK